jgi:hypothetical protein
MSNLQAIATSTALVLLLSCNCIMPTKAYTDDAYIYDIEATSNQNMTCAAADPSVFTSPACYTLETYFETGSINGDVKAIFEEYRYEFYGQELEGGLVDESVDERIGQVVKISLHFEGADYNYCWVNIGTLPTLHVFLVRCGPG